MPVSASSSSFWSRSVSNRGADSGRPTEAGGRSKVTTALRTPRRPARGAPPGPQPDHGPGAHVDPVVRADGDDRALRGRGASGLIAEHLHRGGRLLAGRNGAIPSPAPARAPPRGRRG